MKILARRVYGWFCLLALAAANCFADSPITAVAVDPNGSHVVTGSQTGLEIRSLPDLVVTLKLQSELENIHDLAFSPNGTQLLVAGGAPGSEGLVEVLSWPNPERLRQVRLGDDVIYAVAWSADGSRWASAGANGECHVVSAESSEITCRYQGHSRPVQAICFLVDNSLVISASHDQTVRVWDGTIGETIRTLDNHTAGVNDLAVKHAEQNEASFAELISVGDDRTVRIWQPTIGRLVRFAVLPAVPRTVAWVDGDIKQLAVGCDDGRVRVLAYESLDIVGEVDASIGRIFDLCLTAQKDLIVVGEKGIRILTRDEFARLK